MLELLIEKILNYNGFNFGKFEKKFVLEEVPVYPPINSLEGAFLFNIILNKALFHGGPWDAVVVALLHWESLSLAELEKINTKEEVQIAVMLAPCGGEAEALGLMMLTEFYNEPKKPGRLELPKKH